jgi:hypothetical protein
MFSLAFSFLDLSVPQHVPKMERRLAVDASGVLQAFLSSTLLSPRTHTELVDLVF